MVRNIRNIVHHTKECMTAVASPLDQIDSINMFRKQLDTDPEPVIAVLEGLRDHLKSPSNQRWFVTGSEANLLNNASLLAKLSDSELAADTTQIMDNSSEIDKGSWIVKLATTQSS